jgi:hypothetical protein
MFASGVNGLGLALVIPCLQSLTADFHPAESRGKAFGWMFCVSSLGAHRDVCIGAWRDPTVMRPHLRVAMTGVPRLVTCLLQAAC